MHDAPATQCNPGIIRGLSAAASASQPLLQRALSAGPGGLREHTTPGSVAAPDRVAAAEHPQRSDLSRSAHGDGSGAEQMQCPAGSGSGGGSCAAEPGRASGAAGGAAASHSASDSSSNSPAAPAAAVPELVSGAGHDALAMAEAGPMGMLFVRCRNGGISHSPQERVDDVDVAAATAALLAYLQAEVV